MLVFSCHICKTVLSANESQAGQLVRCAQCLTTLRVPAQAATAASTPKPALLSSPPAQQPDAAAATAAASTSASSIGANFGGIATAPPPPTSRASTGGASQQRLTVPTNFKATGGEKRYGFNCAYCSSRLEATESMAAQEGQCPTCGNTIVIPILDRYGRLIDPITKQIIKQDPHPVHAYAAAGDRAPKIVRQTNGSQIIICPRCQTMSSISSNNCKSCGMPFTIEGTTLEAAGANNGFCVASLVLGIIGVPGGCTGIVPLLAVVFGFIGLSQVSKSGNPEGGGKGMAIAGIICGVIGLVIFAWIVMK